MLPILKQALDDLGYEPERNPKKFKKSEKGRDHVILEQAGQGAQVWCSRWDSFTLNTPNWTAVLAHD